MRAHTHANVYTCIYTCFLFLQQAFHNFQQLDERINFVARKVVHLGDQLESVNIPRARNAEALHMMHYLNLFFSEVGCYSFYM